MSKSIHIKQGLILSMVANLLISQIPLYASTGSKMQTSSVITPIRWTRSSEEKVLGVVERGWNWQIANSIETPITEERLIWDGAYNPYYSSYIDRITGDKHPSATWKTQNRVDLRRFRGYFEIPEGYTTEDFVRLQSIVQDQYSHLNDGNIIPINDNIYVFVYPEEVSSLINDNPSSEYYFMNYLALWTGTANKTNNGVIQSFYGKSGTYADRNTKIGPKVTDGWYAEATIDNIGNVMHETTGGAGSGTQFVIDLFTEDNSPRGGGGMDKMILEFKENPKAEVHALSETYAIPSGKTSTVQEAKGLLANEGTNQAVTVKIIEGTNGAFRTDEVGKSAYNLYKDGEKVAYITYVDERGQFEITPEDDFVGEIRFDYKVQDKLGKSDVATACLYVMPYVDVVYEDSETKEVLLQVRKQYGNPYESLPQDIIWINEAMDARELLDIEPLDVSRLDKDKNYEFIEGKIQENGQWKADIEVLPYIYKFTQANEEIQLQYEVSTKDVEVHIYHQYGDEGDDYTRQLSLEVGNSLQVKEYIDTTADGKYAVDEKYEIDMIEIYEQETGDVSELISANIKDGESIILEGDKVYKLTFKYKIKEIEKPSIPGEEETEKPSIPGEEETEKPSIPGEEENNKPSVPGEEENEKPSVPEEGEIEKPSVPGEEETEKPSIPGEEENNKPSVPGEEETEKPSIPGQEENNKPSVPGEEETEKPSVPGEEEIEKPSVPGEGEIEKPSVPGGGGINKPDVPSEDDENPGDEVEIPDEDLPTGPINPEHPEVPSEDEDEIEIPDETLPGTGANPDDSITTPEIPEDEVDIPDEELPSGPINPERPDDMSGGSIVDGEYEENPDKPELDDFVGEDSENSKEESKEESKEDGFVDNEKQEDESHTKVEASGSGESNQQDEGTDNPKTGDQGLFWQIVTLAAALCSLSLLRKKTSR